MSIKDVSERVATTAVACVAALALYGGVSAAQAATEAVANNSVNSAKVVDDSIRGVDLRDGSITAVDLHPALRSMWVRIDGDGSVERSRGVEGVHIIPPDDDSSAGRFVITFERPVGRCGWFATPAGQQGGPATTREATVEQVSDDALVVRTFSSAGVRDYAGVNVLVMC